MLEDSLKELDIFSYHVDSKQGTLTISLIVKCFYLLNHLAGHFNITGTCYQLLVLLPEWLQSQSLVFVLVNVYVLKQFPHASP